MFTGIRQNFKLKHKLIYSKSKRGITINNYLTLFLVVFHVRFSVVCCDFSFKPVTKTYTFNKNIPL